MMVLLHPKSLPGFSWSFLLSENRPLTNGITDSPCAQSPGAIGGCAVCVVWELLSWAPYSPDHSQADWELFFRRIVEPSEQVDLAIGPVALDHEHLQSTPQKT